MKATALQQINSSPYLKVVNNSLGKKDIVTETINRIHINTLVPSFNYINRAGEVTSPNKFNLL